METTPGRQQWANPALIEPECRNQQRLHRVKELSAISWSQSRLRLLCKSAVEAVAALSRFMTTTSISPNSDRRSRKVSRTCRFKRLRSTALLARFFAIAIPNLAPCPLFVSFISPSCLSQPGDGRCIDARKVQCRLPNRLFLPLNTPLKSAADRSLAVLGKLPDTVAIFWDFEY